VNDPQALVVTTLIARAQGLQRQYAEAQATLDTVAAVLDGAPSHVRVRYLLERGRTFNSSGAAARAVPLFTEALALAECNDDAFYAVDAAHMLGIAAPPAARLEWNLKALALAEKADEPRAQRWDASLYNNIGWTYHDRGDYATALRYWEKGLAARKERGDAANTRIAQWTVARGLRSLGRLDDALAIQLALATELDTLGTPDGYVYEELAEIALARGDAPAAAPWARKAHAMLKDKPGSDADEAKRAARLAQIAAGTPPTPAAKPQP
jgi:tetratricopeptide (TPR) repeat protein